MMKVGIGLSGLGARHYPAVAAVAEANGFESLWMPEHLVFPAEMPPRYSYTPDGYPPMHPDTPTFDPWVVLAAVSTATETIRLASGVFILPLRHPVMVARSVVTLDRMSGGRVVLGIGVGWMPDEFEIVGASFHDRGRRADEMIVLMRKLWSEPSIEFHGEFFDIPPIRFEPKPINKQQGIPIIVGGTSPGALRRAGRLGDGWTHHAQIKVSLFQGETNPGVDEEDWAELKSHLEVINRHRAEAGRDSEPFEVIAGMGTTLDAIRRCEDLGVSTCLVGPAPKGLRGTKDDFVEWIKRFSDEVIAKV
jgi:probable F420-dependent oxidoreductase